MDEFYTTCPTAHGETVLAAVREAADLTGLALSEGKTQIWAPTGCGIPEALSGTRSARCRRWPAPWSAIPNSLP